MAEVINANVFDATKKFVDFAGLDYFWEKAKAYVDAADKVTADKIAALETTVGDADSGLVKDVKAIQDELNSLSGGAGSIATQISNAIGELDVEDTAVEGEYVSSVSEVDGKIAVTRVALPDYTEVYDAKGAAATAEQNAKDYADSLADNYDAAGTAAGLDAAMNTRVAKLEAIDHEKLASDASAAAVATILDNAPASFDTLKEVADWIANNDHADDVAGLMTDVENLKKIDHDAYKAADTALETSLKGYVNGKDSEMDARVKVLEGHDVYVKSDVDSAIADAKKAGTDAAAALDAYKPVIEKSVEDAQAAAIAKAAEDAAKMLESYYTKTEVDGLVAGAKTYADGLKTEIEGVIAENERVTSEALTDLNDRVKVIEAQDVYVKADVDDAIADAKKAGTDAAAALDTYKGEAAQALADNSTADQAYAKAYTDELFNSFQFASTTDIDTIFA